MEQCISYKIIQSMSFFEMFPPKREITKYDEKQLIEKFHKCKSYYSGHELKNGKLYSCCFSGDAKTAHLFDVSKEYIFNSNYYANNITENIKKELVEFNHDYNKKEYVDFYRYCNGFPSFNNEFYENGVTQLKK